MANPQGWRKEIEASVENAKNLISKSVKPISKTPFEPTNDPDKQKQGGLLKDLEKLGFNDVATLLSLFKSEVKGQQDDSKFLLENLVQLLAKWGDESTAGMKLTAGFIDNLWNALPHPPLTSLGTKYKYRSADGSFNNILSPDLGKANTPYARSAKPTILQNVALPDPGVIFDSLMAREGFEPHPNKISSMLFYLATIIIHDIFRTDHNDYNNSMTSSYLDLAPLYGSNQDEQNTVRAFKDGKLKPDCFSEKRILGFPPGVGVFLIMFNRYHNFVVTQLALINENGRFKKPKDDDPESKSAWAKYDEDLFQTGRLITCGLYVNVVLKDYVRTILSLNRTDSKWDLDPRTTEGKTLFNSPAAEGTGNQVSAEFNLIYRWHSAVSARDEKWTQDVYASMFPGKNPEEVTLRELLGTLRQFEAKLPDDPLQRPFAKLQRLPDGSLPDDELVKILEASISDIAGSFGANKVPKILRSVEILGIIQARSWNIASLNEFRAFSGLTPHKTFEDINPDPVVAKKLQDLYDHPDFVEMYPGLVAEKAKPPMSPGSGLCVNFTTSYSILSDAVGLVRGDRFYTVDYTPKSLTNWGYQEVQYDVNVDDGCVLHKLILRAFPDHFTGNSIYAHFPFVIPAENLAIQNVLNRADKYSWQKPARRPEAVIIKSYDAAQKILKDQENWKVTWATKDFLFPSRSEASTKLFHKNVHSEDWDLEAKKFYEETTSKLLKAYSHKVPGQKKFQVDIVRDVSNLVNARYAASVFSLPIKTEEHQNGIYTEQELYQVLSIMYRGIFQNDDITKSFETTEASFVLAKQLGKLVELDHPSLASPGLVAGLVAKLHKSSKLSTYGTQLIQKMVESKLSIKEIIFMQILPTASSMSTYQSQVFSEVLDFYLGDGAKYRGELYTLSHANTKEADETLSRYFIEGVRLSSTTRIQRLYKPASSVSSTSVEIEGTTITPHTIVTIDLYTASASSPDTEINLSRPLDTYLHPYTGLDLNIPALTSMFKVIVGLPGLDRARGSAPGGEWYGESQGVMKRVKSPGDGSGNGISGGGVRYMTPDQSAFVPWPTTMKVTWDAE